MITRRGLLAGILGAGIAPAIVHNPMRLWVPSRSIEFPVLQHLVRGLPWPEASWFRQEGDGGFLVPRQFAGDIKIALFTSDSEFRAASVRIT